MPRNDQNETGVKRNPEIGLTAKKERSLEENFLHRKIKETSKLLIRHREKIEKMREQEETLEEELRNLGRVIEKVEKYEQIKLPNLSLDRPVESAPEKVLV